MPNDKNPTSPVHPDVTTCGACGGHVRRVARPGRPWVARGVTYMLPADLELATCEQCGEEWLDAADARAIDAAIDAQRVATLAPTGTGGE